MRGRGVESAEGTLFYERETMKKIEITNRSDATEQFACILVAEAFGKDEYIYQNIKILRTKNTEDQEN